MEEFLRLTNTITLSNSERIEITSIIRNYLKSIFGDRKSDFTVINGKKIDNEVISKLPNNRLALKMICYDSNKKLNFNIKNKFDLFNFIKNNLYDLYNPNGKYFDIIYQAVSNTSTKGKKIEKEAFLYFKNIVKLKRKIDINIIEPTLNEDIGGIDGIFFINDKKYTIQVKPLFRIEDYKKDNDKFIVFCDGVLKDLKTDYLIVNNQNDTFCFRNPIVNGVRSIKCVGSYFLIDKSNLI